LKGSLLSGKRIKKKIKVSAVFVKDASARGGARTKGPALTPRAAKKHHPVHMENFKQKRDRHKKKGGGPFTRHQKGSVGNHRKKEVADYLKTQGGDKHSRVTSKGSSLVGAA